ncbi:hypothetical protein AVEN_150740-1 [Araneus ventricosus]|uniref:Uncharacterized protein n=1 Tax=Araneus ventricosus TaxID=182803 RepID=A0A4Y2N6L0_ARAVE|nr:hypothetical protein AVEN_150740-1 [Araneus ventricosus]
MKIFRSCHLQLSKQKYLLSPENDIDMSDLDLSKNENLKPGCTKDDPEFIHAESTCDYLNKSIRVSPIVKKDRKGYCTIRSPPILLHLILHNRNQHLPVFGE